MSNLVWIDETVIEFVPEIQHFIKDEDVPFSRIGVTPKSGDRPDGDLWYEVHVIMKPLYIALLPCVMNEAAVKAGASCIRPCVEL